MKARFYSLIVVLVSLLVACGGNDKPTNTPSSSGSSNMDDALALLPGNAIAVGTFDARSFFSSQTFGADLSKLVESYMPIGAEAGFKASTDVDRVTWASYSYSGIDAAAVIIGRFDQDKIKAAAANHTANKQGNYLVVSQYAGRDVYTVSNVGFTLLGPTRAIAGSEAGIRRVLERIKDNRVQRDITKWMLDTVETQGAAAAVAADFASQPMPQQAMQQAAQFLPFVNGMKQLRVLVQFQQNATQIAGAMSYADAATATTNSDKVKDAAKLTSYLSVFGIKVSNIDIKPAQNDVQFSMSLDDQSLRTMLQQAPNWIGPPATKK